MQRSEHVRFVQSVMTLSTKFHVYNDALHLCKTHCHISFTQSLCNNSYMFVAHIIHMSDLCDGPDVTFCKPNVANGELKKWPQAVFAIYM